MIMRTRNRSGIRFLPVALLIFVFPGVGRAENLFRLFPELQMNGYYGSNILLQSKNGGGDFGSAMVGGFYLDDTSAARYAALHYDTFAQLFVHRTQDDRAGEGQFVSATDDENLSPTTKLRLSELFYRDATPVLIVTTSDQAPQFNSLLALLLFANEEASVNRFQATLTHDWGRNWSSGLDVHQGTFWTNGSNGTNSNTSYAQGIDILTSYAFSNQFSLGAGNRYYDFQFSGPGKPDQQEDWPFAQVIWQPFEPLYFAGFVGVVISHVQGRSGEQLNPGGIGQLAYHFSQRGRLMIYGGQEPELASIFGQAGYVRGGRGALFYDFTQRLTGTAGGGYFDFNGNGFSGTWASWGVGLSDRVNQWLSVNTRFVQVRRVETGASQFIPSGSQSGQWAVGDYYIVGLAVSIEAFRWSWQ